MAEPLSRSFPAIHCGGPWGLVLRSQRLLLFSAQIALAILTPRFHQPQLRQRTAQVFCCSAWQTLPSYLLACTLISAVLTRLVTVSAAGYGLSHLALEGILRVFVIEILPLAATLFVATRAVPLSLRHFAQADVRRHAALADVLPCVLGNAMAVGVLAVFAGILSLVVAYLVVHGFSPWAMPAYTRLIGQVFDPVLSLVLLTKVVWFGVAVGIAPATAVLETRQTPANLEMRIMVRLLFALLLVEVFFLALRLF